MKALTHSTGRPVPYSGIGLHRQPARRAWTIFPADQMFWMMLASARWVWPWMTLLPWLICRCCLVAWRAYDQPCTAMIRLFDGVVRVAAVTEP